MLKRIPLLFLLGGSLALAAETPTPGSPAPSSPPSEASIKQLLAVAEVRKLADSVMAQMDNLMQQAVVRAAQGRPIPAKVQKEIDQSHSEMTATMKDLLDWNKLEP